MVTTRASKAAPAPAPRLTRLNAPKRTSTRRRLTTAQVSAPAPRRTRSKSPRRISTRRASAAAPAPTPMPTPAPRRSRSRSPKRGITRKPRAAVDDTKAAAPVPVATAGAAAAAGAGAGAGAAAAGGGGGAVAAAAATACPPAARAPASIAAAPVAPSTVKTRRQKQRRRRRRNWTPILFWMHVYSFCAVLLSLGTICAAPAATGRAVCGILQYQYPQLGSTLRTAWLVWASLLGAGLCFDGSNRQLWTLTDLFHAAVGALWSYAGDAGVTSSLTVAARAWAHNGYHLLFCIVKWSVDPEGARRSLLMQWYTVGAVLTVVAHMAIGTAADGLADDAADALTTPWHWCLYGLTGFAPLALWSAYKGAPVLALYYPYSQVERVRSVLAALRLQGAPAVLLPLVVAVPLVNWIVVYFAIRPRLDEAVAIVRRHRQRLVSST